MRKVRGEKQKEQKKRGGDIRERNGRETERKGGHTLEANRGETGSETLQICALLASESKPQLLTRNIEKNKEKSSPYVKPELIETEMTTERD